jgi:hypothetical protein
MGLDQASHIEGPLCAGWSQGRWFGGTLESAYCGEEAAEKAAATTVTWQLADKHQQLTLNSSFHLV